MLICILWSKAKINNRRKPIIPEALSIYLQLAKKMKRNIHVAAIIFLQFFLQYCAAQNNEIKFNLVEGPNGKPLGKIKNMTQDPNGYIWLAGEGEKCIYRYDGNRIITFRHDDANPNSLGGTSINSVYAEFRNDLGRTK